jgi:predicted dehydrogenase
MSEDGKLQHGLIGCGRISETHADAFQRLPEVTLHCAVDPDAAAARALADRFGIGSTAGDFHAALRDPELDSISILTPHDLHVPIAVEAIRLGKHVLIEKPVAIDAAGLSAMAEQRRTSTTVIMPVTQHRFDPLVIEVAALVRSGALGQLSLLRGHLECVRPKEYYSDSPWRGRWASEGGSVLMNQAYHVVDLMLWLGGPVGSLSGRIANVANADVMETEDTVSATMAFTSGALGSLTVTGAAGAEWNSLIEIAGTGGSVAFDIGSPNQLLHLRIRDRRAMMEWKRRLLEATQVPIEAPSGMSYYGTSHRAQARAFAEAVAGRPHGGASLEEALATVECIRGIYESAVATRSAENAR